MRLYSGTLIPGEPACSDADTGGDDIRQDVDFANAVIVAVRDVKVSAGAGFVVVSTGDIMTMPGLPKTPSAESIDIDDQGQITGLF